MRKCGYCGEKENLTKEHIIPNAMVKFYPEYRTIMDKKSGVHNSPATIKDVCQECNNEKLSELDKYGTQLNNLFFKKVVERPKRRKFVYSFHKLQRWLLKIVYNISRAHKSKSVFVFERFAPYILGEDKFPPYETNLHVGIIQPVRSKKTKNVLLPRALVIDDWYSKKDIIPNIPLLWSIGLNSYYFLFQAWDHDFGIQDRKTMIKEFDIVKEMTKLPHNRKEVYIPKGFVFPRHYINRVPRQ